MAVGRAVVEDQAPGQRRGRQRTILGIGCASRELDQIADLPGRAGGRRADRRTRGRVARGDRHGRGAGRVVGVADAQARGVDALARVRVARGDRGRVVVLAVAVQVPGIAQAVTRVRVARAGAVELNGQRRGAGAGRGGRDRCWWLVRRGEADLTDGAAVEVGVEELAARPDLELHWIRSPRREGADPGRVGNAVQARQHRPDAVARVVGGTSPRSAPAPSRPSSCRTRSGATAAHSPRTRRPSGLAASDIHPRSCRASPSAAPCRRSPRRGCRARRRSACPGSPGPAPVPRDHGPRSCAPAS
jgi:hypothetical protein